MYCFRRDYYIYTWSYVILAWIYIYIWDDLVIYSNIEFPDSSVACVWKMRAMIIYMGNIVILCSIQWLEIQNIDVNDNVIKKKLSGICIHNFLFDLKYNKFIIWRKMKIAYHIVTI